MMPQRSSVPTYWRLKAMNPASVNGAGDRTSQAQKPASGMPCACRYRSMKAKPAANGTGRTNSARSMR
jgi:hypothetical protein